MTWRVYREFVDLANGTTGRRQTLYNASLEAVRLRAGHTRQGQLQYPVRQLRPLGRPRSINPPDSAGSRRQVSYGRPGRDPQGQGCTSRDAAGQIVEQDVTTTETFDHQGRLGQVQEPSGKGGVTTTVYKYDGAGT